MMWHVVYSLAGKTLVESFFGDGAEANAQAWAAEKRADGFPVLDVWGC